MKRGRHDSDYDEVRRRAGYTRPQPEFPDEEEDRAVAARVMQKSEEFKARMAEIDKQDAQRNGEMAARLEARSKEISRRIIVREYAALGVAPPEPLVSLALLRKIGWHIEEVGGRNVLVGPSSGAPARKTREQWEAERQGGEGS